MCCKSFFLFPSFSLSPPQVMNFLVGNHGPRNQDWLDLFEVVIVGSRKPAFLEDRSAYMMRVASADGSLRNVDGVEEPVDEFLAAGKVFQGGNWKYLLEMLKLKSGDNVLYVGDHMYRSVAREEMSDIVGRLYMSSNPFFPMFLYLSSLRLFVPLSLAISFSSDILRSKRSLGWRTCLVIPELAEEVASLQRYADMDAGLQELRR